MSILVDQFDLSLLRLLVLVYETRSVSKAGVALGLSQPASSNALARLRDALGDPLFVRTRDGMMPTDYAEEIVPKISDHIAGITAVLNRSDTFEPSTSSRTFRLSLSGLGESIFLPPLADRILAAAPQVRIFNVSAPLPDLISALERREADVAIGILNIKGRGVRSATLFEEAYVVVAGAGLLGRRGRPRNLANMRIVLAAPSATYAASIEEKLDREGLSSNITLRLRHFGALPELLSTLEVVAIIPGSYGSKLQAARQATVLPVPLPLRPYRVRMVWHENTSHDPACMWLREQIVDSFSSASDKNRLPGSTKPKASVLIKEQ